MSNNKEKGIALLDSTAKPTFMNNYTWLAIKWMNHFHSEPKAWVVIESYVITNCYRSDITWNLVDKFKFAPQDQAIQSSPLQATEVLHGFLESSLHSPTDYLSDNSLLKS